MPNTSTPDDLIAWLRAQIDADKKYAEQWHDLECDIHVHLGQPGITAQIAASRMYSAVPGAICTCGGPDRMRREADAKHATLDHARRNMHPHAWSPWLDVVKHLAAVYADRPGYKEEWKP